jgi:hypothetical protein
MAQHEKGNNTTAIYERALDHSDRCPSPQFLDITEDEKEQIIRAVGDSGMSIEDLISAGLEHMFNMVIEKHQKSRSPFTLGQILNFEILLCDQYDGKNDLLEKPIQLPFVAYLCSGEETTDYNIELSMQAKSNLAKIWKLTQISHKMILRTAALLAANEINKTVIDTQRLTSKKTEVVV